MAQASTAPRHARQDVSATQRNLAPAQLSETASTGIVQYKEASRRLAQKSSVRLATVNKVFEIGEFNPVDPGENAPANPGHQSRHVKPDWPEFSDPRHDRSLHRSAGKHH